MRIVRTVVILLALSLAAAGCFNPFSPLISDQRAASVPAPIPNSPANAVKLFQWCWQNRDATMYATVFADGYRFIFAANDSAGNPYHDRPWLREDELAMAQNMFQGGTDRPPASEIVIAIDNTLNPQPDTRPGHAGAKYRSINTTVNLKFTVMQNGTPDVSVVSGHAQFYLVRGDVPGVIPPELAEQNYVSDSTRWWIERWEDQTAGLGAGSIANGAAKTMRTQGYLPPRTVSFGELKREWIW